MKSYVLLLLPLLFLALGCGEDDPCEDINLPTIEEYIEANNLPVEPALEGLFYTILDEGGPERPSPTATVTVNYTGTLTNDVMFDGTPADGRSPIRFALNNLIRGWQIGIPLIGRGGRILLYTPSEIAYGSARAGSICPNSDLIFEIELVNFVE